MMQFIKIFDKYYIIFRSRDANVWTSTVKYIVIRQVTICNTDKSKHNKSSDWGYKHNASIVPDIIINQSDSLMEIYK